MQNRYNPGTIFCIVLSVCLLLVPGSSRAQRFGALADPKRDAFIESLIKQMTLREKLGQLTQYSGSWSVTGPAAPQGGEAQIRTGEVGSFLNIFGADVTRSLQKIAVEESRLKIPLLFAHDIIHGFRTIFPVPLAEAASWNPELVERAARVAAEEGTAWGLHWTFAPMVDIARDPRWGRIVEGSGEDPYLGTALAIARVRGFQGTDLKAPNTLLACAKHFVAYGGAEAGRDYNVVDVSEKTLRELYLPPFQAAVEAGAATVMASFNEISGRPMHANEPLIDGVLRGEWGFSGLVVSDYTGVLELLNHGIGATPEEVAVSSLQAGVDVDMVSGFFIQNLEASVKSGKLSEKDVDAAVRRILLLKWELGLFEDPYRYSDMERQRTHTLMPEYRAASREMARQSIVLLKNQGNILPLAKGIQNLAVIGALASDSASVLGAWAATGQANEAVSVLQGIREAVGNGTKVTFARGAEIVSSDTSGFAEAIRVAQAADAVVLVVGEHRDMSGEAASRTSLDLPGVQPALVRAIQATGKPLVVVLMNGRPLTIPWMAENVPAILETWYLGSEMGHAVADVLFGDYNPGGKLPVTFPRNVGQVPIYYNHKNTGRPPREQEKYTSKYIDAPWTPLYPFGYGLSYTTFSYSEPTLSNATMGAADSLTVTFTVTNTGDRAGDEVVQMYVQDEVGSLTRPVKELKGFRRIHLEPKASQSVTFSLKANDLAFYTGDLKRIVEPGFFKVSVGGNSEEVKSARFEVR